MRSPTILLTALLVLASATPGQSGHREAPGAPRTRFAGRLMPCHVADVEGEALCGRFEVPENRAASSGRRIGLRVVVLPATSAEVAEDPLVFLAGGGVVPATRYARFFAKGFANLRLHRDILLVDQRGSGGSNELDCALPTDRADPTYRDAARFVAAVRGCRQQLERKADLRFYTTPIAMDDLDAVRNWLGYPRLNLMGVSYGTQAAMVYLRQHGERVRTISLQGVVAFDVPMWLEIPRSMQHALDEVFSACRGQQACHSAFPRLAEEFDALLQQLADKPVKVEVAGPKKGEHVAITLDAEVLGAFVTSALFGADRIHDLPLLIHLAAKGDRSPIARRLAEIYREPNEVPNGVYYSIICNEELHFDATALAAAVAGTFMGGLRIDRDLLACRQWPHGWEPKNYWAPVVSAVPALVMTGSLDAVTPPRYGARAAKSLSNARVLLLPGRGHNDADPCVLQIDADFITAGSAGAIDIRCLAETPPQSFALRPAELIN